MKVCYLLMCAIVCLLYSQHILAQTAPSIAWQKTLGGPGNDIIEDIYPTADGNYILFAIADSSGGDVSISCQPHGIHDIWIIKIDANGNIIWQQCFGGSKEEGNPFSKIIQTSDGGYLFITESWSSDFDVLDHHAYSDAYTVKLDANGNKLWAKSFGGYIYDVPRNIYELPDHKYLMMSRTTSSDGDVPATEDSTEFDAWIFIIDDDGNIVTNKVYGGSGDDDLYKALPAANGNIALFGLTSSNDGDLEGLSVDSTDAWMLTIDPAGNVLSSMVYGGPNIEYFFDALNTDDGGYIAFGESGDPGGPVDQGYWHGEQDYWVMKLDAAGVAEWQGLYGGTGREQFRRACKLPDNTGYILAGSTNSYDGDVVNNTSDSGRDWWIVQIGENGVLFSSVALGGTGSDFAYAIVEPGIAVGGTLSDDGDVVDLDGTADGWIMQLSYATTLDDGGTANPVDFYPNPSSDVMMIEHLPPLTEITVKNVYGQIMYSGNPDQDHFELRVHDWTPGIYFMFFKSLNENWAPSVKSFEVMH